MEKPDIEFKVLNDTVETARNCEKQVEAYKKYVDDLTVEELEREEQEIIKVINSYEEVLKEKEYPLGKKCVFEGTTYLAKVVHRYICDILNRREVEYSYTLGMYQLYRYWENPGTSVKYPILDNTLRTLQSQDKFKGVNEWEKILVINEYFKQNNKDMTMDYLQDIFYAHLHSAIIDKLQLNKPNNNQESQESPIELVEPGI